MNTKKIALAAVITAILPVVALAQIGSSAPSNFSPNLTSLGQTIVNQLWIIFTIIAVIMFVIAGILFLTSQGDPEKVTKARQAFLWGVAGIIVGVLAYTIVALVRGALGA
ncbi:MAG: hypothetical protein A2401_03005 [Candidatus Staskawiczbacteria bacterium RIFOXYC1_FULL_38_18]|uniref:Conjugal transfer protein TrbC n=1 Tax=Candidatus Staskawiczbacteria bacterium RIFOXYC1_FULL_38_18 TaxID=1802229 RepID=A0A1G2JF93_9BACT|nr:MAG: hypothetical protein A2401_03005 [Candidatus Staskawiczbacteria bacterium RIFOXYC1_FULL_38_18]